MTLKVISKELPVDIIVTTPKSEILNSAAEAANCIKNGGGYYFRRFSKAPANLQIGSRIYYVEDGYIRGYAVVSAINIESMTCSTTGRNWSPGAYAILPANSWKWIKPIPMKGFQGYRYFDGENVEVVGGWTDAKPKI